MMLFYITFIDPVSDASAGVWKKVKEQAMAMAQLIENVYCTGWMYPKAVLFSGTEIIETELAMTKKDYVEVLIEWMKKYDATQAYIRYPLADKWFMDLLDYQKRKEITTVLEFPTYPYDKELQEGIPKMEDIHYREGLYQYIDRAVTYTADTAIWNIPCIRLSNGISLKNIQLRKKEKRDNRIVLLTISTMRAAHGYERLLKGMELYYKKERKYDIRLKMIGVGPEERRYKSLAEQLGLNTKVEFLGCIEPWETEKLDIQYEQSDIAVGPLGMYKMGIDEASPIKGSEYCVRGMPMICGYDDLRFPDDWEFIMKVPNNAEPIDINRVIDFYERVILVKDYPKIMYDYAKEHLTWDTIMEPVMSYYRQAENRVNSYIELRKAVQNKKIIVFGCGKLFGEFVLRYPSLCTKIECILDNNAVINTYACDRYVFPVIRPAELRKADLLDRIIIFCSAKWKEMKEQLDEIAGQEYIFFHYPWDVDYRKDRELGVYHRIIVPVIEKLREYSNTENAVRLLGVRGEDEMVRCMERGKVYAIPRLTVVLTPRCSLRCKECNNLMWKFSGYRGDLETGKIIVSLRNIIETMDIIPCIELIGGEPFIAGNLRCVLDYLVGQEKVLAVEITTNATIVPSVEIMEKLRHHKVHVHVSNYGNIVEQDRFVRYMDEYNVQFRLLEFEEQWIATGGIQKRNRDAGALVRQYYHCASGNLCKTLWEDRIYPCARAASLAVLGIVPDCPCVDSSRKEGLSERLKAFYVVPSCGACDYCDVAVENPVYVQPAVQLERR